MNQRRGLSLAQFISRPVYVKESALVPRVVNGTPVALGELPYQVGFRYRYRGDTYRTFCGGSLIREDKIVSAAHCFGESVSSCFESVTVSANDLRGKVVVAGTVLSTGNSRRQDGQWRRLKLVMYPGEYEFPFYSDIAVVITFEPFVFNENVDKIAFATTFKDYRGTCLASGYGRTSSNLNIQSEKLLKANLDVIPNYWCARVFRRNMKELVCTGIAYTDIGKGDSGGPLVCRNTGQQGEGKYGLLVGVTSGTGYGRASFFTRISDFAKYVESNRALRALWHFSVVKMFCLSVLSACLLL